VRWIFAIKAMKPFKSKEEGTPLSCKLFANLNPEALNTGIVS
jgi:hypothetical protein